MPEKRSFIYQYWPGMALFAISLLITFLSYQDYGVAWDEHIQRGIGWVSYDYITKGDTTLKHFEDREYGVGYELILTTIEKNTHMDLRAIFLMRHLVNHIFFLVCMFCGYVLVQRLFRNRFLSSLGFVMMTFHPRIYAHSFFNSKDIPFLDVFLVALLLAHIAFQKDKTWWYLLLGMACGYATNIRILGMMLTAILCTFFLADIITAIAEKKKVSNPIIHLLFFIGASCLTLWGSWPLLWHSPVANFTEAFDKLSHFPWTGYVLFGGKTYVGSAVPWFYLPGWFCITTPELWLLLGAAGIMLLLIVMVRNPLLYLKNTPQRNFLLYLACIALPVFSVIVLHSVVYDDWRHVYFIYPPFVILCLYAINSIRRRTVRCVVYGICIAQVVFTGVFMVRNHPFQQVYFNNLVSHKDEYLRKNYDLEYWGCSFKQGLDYILAHDTSSVIKIQSTILPLANNLKMLPDDQGKRIQVVDEDKQPDYFITNFRSHPDDYKYPVVFYEIKVLNSTIMRVYKLH